MASFLKNLFTPKWQHKDAAVRLAAINQELSQEVLTQLALHDPDESVRLAAIALIKDTNTLTSLFSHKSQPIKQAALTQFAQLKFSSNETSAILQGIAQLEDHNTLITLASYWQDETIVEAALTKIQHAPALLEFILSTPSSKARQITLQNIDDADSLKKIELHFKNKDKTITRIAKEKLAAQANAAQQALAAQQHIENLVEQAQSLAKQSFKPTYAGLIAHLKNEAQLVSFTKSQLSTFNESIATCEAILEKNAQLQAEEQQQQAKQLQAQTLQHQTIEQAKSLFETCKSGNLPTLEALTPSLIELSSQWLNVQTLQKTNKLNDKEFEAYLAPLNELKSSLTALADETYTNIGPVKDENLKSLAKHASLISKRIQAINWPSAFPENKAIHQLEKQLQDTQSRIDAIKQNESGTLTQIHNDIALFENAINEGHLKKAKQLQNTIRKSLSNISESVGHTAMQAFQTLLARFDELNDWQGFAAQPKMEQLCEEMEALHDTDLDAKVLAETIHTLQEQWKALGSLNDNKQQQQLWNRFKKAADIAYLPCKAYYQELGALRIYNQQQREAICTQLEGFYEQNDWQQTDWKAIQHLLDHANTEIKKFSPVNNDVQKTLHARYQQINNLIYGKLIAFYQENAEQKSKLIEDVSSLANQDDIAQAIETCKAIQEKWKQIPTAGRSESVLWKNFRSACDGIFERRNLETQARKQHMAQAIAQASELMAKAQSLATEDNQDSLNELAKFQADVLALTLPAKVKQQHQIQLNNIQQQIKTSIEQGKHQAQQQKWLNAQQLAMQISEAELNGDATALLPQIESTSLPNQALDSFKHRLSHADEAASIEQLRNLCLELEIVLAIDSPADEQTDRMAMQVQRLQQNMGQTLPSTTEQVINLQCKWFGLKAASQEHLSLQKRFFDAINASNKVS